MAGLASGSQAACAGAPRAGGPGAPRRWILLWLDARALGPLAPVLGELGGERPALAAVIHGRRRRRQEGILGEIDGREREMRKSS